MEKLKLNNRFLIKTPTGYKKFDGVLIKSTNRMYNITFDDGTFIKCSDKHAFLSQRGFITADEVTEKDSLTEKKIKTISFEDGIFDVYDPVSVEEHNTYFSNGIVSHNTEFLGSNYTLISGDKLKKMTHGPPAAKKDGLDVYEFAQPDKRYVMTVDVARGVNLDYSAFIVIDVSQSPNKVVAKFQNNKISTTHYAQVVLSVAKAYNNAWVLVEINDIGQQVTDILYEEYEYTNLFGSHNKNKMHKLVMTTAEDSRAVKGIRTTPHTKRIGCNNLKNIIENDKLLTYDFDILRQLSRFVQKGPTYSADGNTNDDLVMCLVLFGYLVDTQFFKDMVSINFRKEMLADTTEEVNEGFIPNIFHSDDVSVEFPESYSLFQQMYGTDRKVKRYKDVFDAWLSDAEQTHDMDKYLENQYYLGMGDFGDAAEEEASYNRGLKYVTPTGQEMANLERMLPKKTTK